MASTFTRQRNTEEAFLFASFIEFVKCWSSGKKSRLVIESMNGQAFVNFSAFLGDPKDVHFKAGAGNRQPKPRKKSERKIQRDKARAAKFQERKKREMALISSPDSSTLPAGVSSGDPRIPTTSSPSQVEAAPTSFLFSEPHPEQFRESSETMMHTSLYFSRIEEERGSDNMESSSIFDQFPVTQSDDQEVATFEGESLVSGGTDQTAVDCQEEHCLGDEEGAAPAAAGAAAAEGRGDKAKFNPLSSEFAVPYLNHCLKKLLKQTEEINAKADKMIDKPMKPKPP